MGIGRADHGHFLAALGDLGQIAEVGPRISVEQHAANDAELVEVLAQARHIDRRPFDIDGIPGDLARRFHAGMVDRHDVKPERRCAGDHGVGRNHVNHGTGDVAVDLQRLESGWYEDQVGDHGAMDSDRRVVDRALDAELGEDHEQARRDARQGQ